MSQAPDPAVTSEIASQFQVHAGVVEVEPYGSGNVNDTFRVHLDAALPSGNGPSRYFILQRINRHVFRQPETIMHNMRAFTLHMQRRLAAEAEQQTGAAQGWQMPEVISAKSGVDWHIDRQGEYWRAITFIENGQTYDRIRDRYHARQAGWALGRFHSLISDLPPDNLFDTLEGFHITPRYLQQYDEIHAARSGAKGSGNADVDQGMAFVEERRSDIGVLEEAKARGELSLRPIHGDPKINNFVIDNATGQAISLVDLDTVKPGLIHYDIGDCLRSCCNPAGEETDDLDAVVFDMDLCREILDGYLRSASTFMGEADYAYIYDSVRLISFELGLRFFSDYLMGNRYFKVKHEEHNLQRARVQFRLCAKVEAHETAIRDLVTELRKSLE